MIKIFIIDYKYIIFKYIIFLIQRVYGHHFLFSPKHKETNSLIKFKKTINYVNLYTEYLNTIHSRLMLYSCKS